MKVYYTKINSERSSKFQLKTIIYEENGHKYVKKQAMSKESVPHLMKMKESYAKLTSSILNPKIKLAKIINESEDSLTFEFIEGVSLESKYNESKKKGTEQEILDEYMTLLQKGFKTTNFVLKTMVTADFKKMLGDFDYTQFEGELCFQGISNIDLIFSNIIFKDDSIYLIDYEWVYDFNIPITFTSFRALHTHNDLHWKMEKHFVFKIVVDKQGFLNTQKAYKKKRLSGLSSLKIKDEQIANLDNVIVNKDSIIKDKNKHIMSQDFNLNEHKNLSSSLNSIISDKDKHIENQTTQIQEQTTQIQKQTTQIQKQITQIQKQTTQIKQLMGNIEHWHNIARDMTLKNRIKNTTRKIIPIPVWNGLKKFKHYIKSKNINTITIIKENILDKEVSEISTVTPLTINKYVFLEPQFTKNVEKELSLFIHKPLISIIMPVYNVEPKWLDLAIKSIENQWYPYWELCISDDKSTNENTIKYLENLNNPKIKVHFLEKNVNISSSSNTALELTNGEYIALMDNDDELTPNALYEVVKAINIYGAEFIYSDEDKLEMDSTFSDPNFKPEFAPDMFLSQNYLSHLGVIKKELIIKVGGFEIGLEGSQDYDLYLKVLEHTNKIHHINKVLYHWRKIPGSTASEYSEKSYAQDAGRKALENAMQRRNIKASVKNGETPGTYKVDYTIIGTPLVSIVIPFKDKPELLTMCIESILEKSTYSNFEIIGISNNSEEKATQIEMNRLSSLDDRIEFYEYNIPFNYSKINNYAVKEYAKGKHILFLNNDIKIITPSWIEEMLMYSQQEQNGAIGAKLYFPNDTVQHAGIVLAPKTIHSAILMYQGFPSHHYGYGSRLRCVNNYSAVTAACLMIKRELFNKIEGFDDKRLSIAYNDVDLCLKLTELGYHNVWTPYCKAYHHESVSRGYEISIDSVERREKEKWNLKNKHKEFFSKTDPFYNKYLTRFGVGSELDDAVTINYESVRGMDFNEEIIFTKNLKKKYHSTVCIFSHFDIDNEIKPYVIYYLQALSKFTDIIFVSTTEKLKKESINDIKVYCRSIIVKKNIGYDFGAWKTGLDSISLSITDYEQLILCNDSVYGPLFNLETIFDKMKSNDFWAMTDNYEIEYHLQSYFMVYTKRAFTHSIFQNFWKNLKIYPNKQILIEKNEIGFSQSLMQTELTYGAYYSCKDRNYVNVLHYYWEELISQHQFPFIKNELLKRNPLSLNIEHWSDSVEAVSNYDIKLIQNTLILE